MRTKIKIEIVLALIKVLEGRLDKDVFFLCNQFKHLEDIDTSEYEVSDVLIRPNSTGYFKEIWEHKSFNKNYKTSWWSYTFIEGHIIANSGYVNGQKLRYLNLLLKYYRNLSANHPTTEIRPVNKLKNSVTRMKLYHFDKPDGSRFGFFFDTGIRLWTVYEIDENDNQVTDADYFPNKNDMVEAHGFNFKTVIKE